MKITSLIALPVLLLTLLSFQGEINESKNSNLANLTTTTEQSSGNKIINNTSSANSEEYNIFKSVFNSLIGKSGSTDGADANKIDSGSGNKTGSSNSTSSGNKDTTTSTTNNTTSSNKSTQTLINLNSGNKVTTSTTNNLLTGCTVPKARNYNPNALIDDGSCIGCRDSNASNYVGDLYKNKIKLENNYCINNNSINFDTQCITDIFDPNYDAENPNCNKACLNEKADNYDKDLALKPNSIHDHNLCNFTKGCMDQSADNYNANAKQDDGSCNYPEMKYGCLNINDGNYDNTANINDPSMCAGNNNTNNEICYETYNAELTGFVCKDDSPVQVTFIGGGAYYYCPGSCYNPQTNTPTTLQPPTNIARPADICCKPIAENYAGSTACTEPFRGKPNDDLCRISGCTNPESQNYSPAATIDDGSCYDTENNTPSTPQRPSTPNINIPQRPSTPNNPVVRVTERLKDFIERWEKAQEENNRRLIPTFDTPTPTIPQTPNQTTNVTEESENLTYEEWLQLQKETPGTAEFLEEEARKEEFGRQQNQPTQRPLDQDLYEREIGETNTRPTNNNPNTNGREIARNIPPSNPNFVNQNVPNTFIPNIIPTNNPINLFNNLDVISEIIRESLGKLSPINPTSGIPEGFAGSPPESSNTILDGFVYDFFDTITNPNSNSFANLLNNFTNLATNLPQGTQRDITATNSSGEGQQNVNQISNEATDPNLLQNTDSQNSETYELDKIKENNPELTEKIETLTKQKSEIEEKIKDIENSENGDPKNEIALHNNLEKIQKEINSIIFNEGITPENSSTELSVIDKEFKKSEDKNFLSDTKDSENTNSEDKDNTNTEFTAENEENFRQLKDLGGRPILPENPAEPQGTLFASGTQANLLALQSGDKTEKGTGTTGKIIDAEDKGVVGKLLSNPKIEVSSETKKENYLTEKPDLGTDLLKEGSTGEAVTALQNFLVSRNVLDKDKITGEFDSDTKSAVKEFQKSVGLTPDGIVGDKTKNAAYAVTNIMLLQNSLLQNAVEITSNTSEETVVGDVKIEKSFGTVDKITAYTDGSSFGYLSPKWHQNKTSSGFSSNIPSIVLPLGPGTKDRQIIKDENGNPVGKIGDVFIVTFRNAAGQEIKIALVAAETGGVHGPGGRFGERKFGEVNIATIFALQNAGWDIKVGVMSLGFPKGTEMTIERTNLTATNEEEYKTALQQLAKEDLITVPEKSSASDKTEGSIDAYYPENSPSSIPKPFMEDLKNAISDFTENWVEDIKEAPIVSENSAVGKILTGPVVTESNPPVVVRGVVGKALQPIVKPITDNFADFPESNTNSNLQPQNIPLSPTESEISPIDQPEYESNQDSVMIPNTDIELFGGLTGTIANIFLPQNATVPETNTIPFTDTPADKQIDPNYPEPTGDTEAQLLEKLQNALGQQESGEPKSKAEVVPFNELTPEDQSKTEIIDIYKQLDLFPDANYQVEGSNQNNNSILPTLPQGTYEVKDKENGRSILPPHVQEILKGATFKPVQSTTGKEPQQGIIPKLIGSNQQKETEESMNNINIIFSASVNINGEILNIDQYYDNGYKYLINGEKVEFKKGAANIHSRNSAMNIVATLIYKGQDITITRNYNEIKINNQKTEIIKKQ